MPHKEGMSYGNPGSSEGEGGYDNENAVTGRSKEIDAMAQGCIQQMKHDKSAKTNAEDVAAGAHGDAPAGN